jgi:hypothetical protein
VADVIIRITDLPDGTVSCVATPNVQDLINLMNHQAGLTMAQGYALRALRAVLEASRELRQGATALDLNLNVEMLKHITDSRNRN